ncbi:MAG: hypothetical protein QXW83_02415 [Nitrososphaerales archaeon]
MLRETIYKIEILALAIVILYSLPHILPFYWLLFIAFFLPYALTALAINILFNCGLLSLGHAGLFTIGMYAVAIPNYWYSINHVEILLLLSLPISFIASVILGAISVKRSKIQFTILTLALQAILYGIFSSFQIFRATYEAEGLPVLFIQGRTVKILFYEFGFTPILFQQVYYYYIVTFFIICTILMWIIKNSQFGRTLEAIRDNELKAEFLGIRVIKYRMIAFIISGTITGFSGALWVMMDGFAAPAMSSWELGIKFAFYPILGGSRTFFGPIIGAFLYELILDLSWGYVKNYWRLIMGFIIIIIIFYTPTGIMGIFHTFSKYLHFKLQFNVKITQIKSNLASQANEINDEYVIIENKGWSAIKMAGWMVINLTPNSIQKHKYVFPEKLANGNTWTLGPNELIFLHTGKGEDKFLPRDKMRKPQFHFYWCKDSFIWSEGGIANLLDEKGNLIHSFQLK